MNHLSQVTIPALCVLCREWQSTRSQWSTQPWHRKPSYYFLCAHSGCPQWSTASRRKRHKALSGCTNRLPYNGGHVCQRSCSGDHQTLSKYHILKKRVSAVQWYMTLICCPFYGMVEKKCFPAIAFNIKYLMLWNMCTDGLQRQLCCQVIEALCGVLQN